MGGAYFTKERIYEMLEIEPVMSIDSESENTVEHVFRDKHSGGQITLRGEVTLDKLVSTLKFHRARISDSDKISKSIDAMQAEARLQSIDTLKFKIVVLKEQLNSAKSQVDAMRREINNL